MVDFNEKLLTLDKISYSLELLWINIVKVELKKKSQYRIAIQFKIELPDGRIRSISYLDVVEINDLWFRIYDLRTGRVSSSNSKS